MNLYILMFKYKNYYYAYKEKENDKFYRFPLVNGDYTSFLEEKMLRNYTIKELNFINRTIVNNKESIIKYIEINLENYTKNLLNDVVSLWIPNYFLNNLYFDQLSRFYLRGYNKTNKVEDITYDGRVLFSKYFFLTGIDLYSDMVKLNLYMINNKVKSGVSTKEEAANAFINKYKNNDFIKANKEIVKEAVAFNYNYHDIFLD